MERTLEIIMEELKLAKEERKPLSEAIEVIDKKMRNLEKEMKIYKLNNGLYHSMSELANYKGKHISSITLVERNKDGTLDTDYIETKQYVHMYYGHPTQHNYVGFLEIEFEDDED